jgi:hypothetical protein
MNATYSVETKTQNFINLRDTSAEFISGAAQIDGISGASTSRLSQAFRGRPLPAETAVPLAKLIDDLESYCSSLHPVPVSLRNPVVIMELLNDFRKRREEWVRPTPFAVILIGGQLFKKMSGQQILTANSYQDCAAFTDTLIARTAAKILDGVTNERLRVTTITNEVRAAETISDKLADFGFNQ